MLDKERRRKEELVRRGLKHKNPIIKTSSFLVKEGISFQLLFDKKTFPVKDFTFLKEVVWDKKITGLRIKTGEEQEDGTGVVVLDLDCKGNKYLGNKTLDELLKRIPFLKNTRTEKTKSDGYHIFIRTKMSMFDKVSKVIFQSPFRIETDPTKKKIEIEIFAHQPITIAPSISVSSKYMLIGDTEEILEISVIEMQNVLRILRDESNDFQITNIGNEHEQFGKVVVTDRDIRESVEIMTLNNIRFKTKGDKVMVYEKNDKSANGDYLLNKNKMLWNIKTYSRISLRDFIKKQNGSYIEREIDWSQSL